MASGTSKKTELKLTNVARASLEELKLDYEDFLRQRGLKLWPREDPRRNTLISRRPRSADDVVSWAKGVKAGRHGQGGQCGRGGQRGPAEGLAQKQSTESTLSTQSTKTLQPSYQEIAANGALTLIAVASSLLRRQLATLEKNFVEEGGFTERLYRVRTANRNKRR